MTVFYFMILRKRKKIGFENKNIPVTQHLVRFFTGNSLLVNLIPHASLYETFSFWFKKIKKTKISKKAGNSRWEK